MDTKVVLHVRLSWHRGRDPAEEFLHELKEKHRVSDAEFLVDGMGYLTALARIERFHETWNGSQISAKRWLTAYTAYYNHHRSHQALDNQPPVEALKQEGSI